MGAVSSLLTVLKPTKSLSWDMGPHFSQFNTLTGLGERVSDATIGTASTLSLIIITIKSQRGNAYVKKVHLANYRISSDKDFNIPHTLKPALFLSVLYTPRDCLDSELCGIETKDRRSGYAARGITTI